MKNAKQFENKIQNYLTVLQPIASIKRLRAISMWPIPPTQTTTIGI